MCVASPPLPTLPPSCRSSPPLLSTTLLRAPTAQPPSCRRLPSRSQSWSTPSLPPLPSPIHVRVLQAVRPLPTSTRGGGEGVASASCFSDPEMTRQRWVASYKAYSMEGKVDSSLSRGFHWVKAMCSELIHCWYGSFFWELFSQYFICICVAVCRVLNFYILFLFCVPLVFCNHRDNNNISNYSVSCFQVLFLMYHHFTATEIYNAIVFSLLLMSGWLDLGTSHTTRLRKTLVW
jgi:hypothetical protein